MSLRWQVGLNRYAGTNGTAHDALLPPAGCSPLSLRAQGAYTSETPPRPQHSPATTFPAPCRSTPSPSPGCSPPHLTHSDAPFRTQFEEVLFCPASLFFLVICSFFFFHSTYLITFQHLLVQLCNYRLVSLPPGGQCDESTDRARALIIAANSNWHLSA